MRLMQRVYDKLAEATYFLGRAQACSRDLKRSDEFVYNVRAFASAGRSVGFMLRREFGRNPSFRSWIRSYERDAYVKFLQEMRDADTHQWPLHPGWVVGARFRESPSALAELEGAANIETPSSVASLKRAVRLFEVPEVAGVYWRWTFDRHPEMPEDCDREEWAREWRDDTGEPPPSCDAVGVCQDILRALESWVERARVAFAGSKSTPVR